MDFNNYYPQYKQSNEEVLLDRIDQLEQKINRLQAVRSYDRYDRQENNARTWSQYQELKKKDPKLYHDRKTQDKLVKDYQQLGTDFEDGDFTKYGDSLLNTR
jgi:hypothetical protein